jgi:hypothetical protein
MLMGVETVLRTDGKPTVFSSGKSNNSPIITACNPNEVNVVQLRRARCDHDVSSMLSANIFEIVFGNMASLQCQICFLLWTPRTRTQTLLAQRKKAAPKCGLAGTFRTQQVSASES